MGFVLIALYHPPASQDPAGEGTGMVRLTVRNGEAFSSITRELSQKDLVKYPWVLNAYAFMMRYDRRIHAGTYQFARGERPKHIIKKLIRGDVLKISVTIPEGYSVRQIAATLTGKAGVPTRTGYAASKHAMAGFFDSLRIELAEYGVSVTMIYPGFVATQVRKRACGADGKPLERSPLNETEVMTAESCAQLILKAAAQCKRELVMTRRGRVGLWLKLIAPRLVDHMASETIGST